VFLRLCDWLELKVSNKLAFDGLLIAYDESADRIVEALELIRKFDPVRYNRLRHDVKRIWVRVIPVGMANFEQSTWTCNVDPRYMRDQPAEAIAGWIVHEATHARLFRAGIGYEGELRARVEQVCLRRELAFAAKLPDGRRVREHAEAVLNDFPDFSDAATREREYASSHETLLHLGTPAWIARTVVSFARWLHGPR
jgi:hypothetical protein